MLCVPPMMDGEAALEVVRQAVPDLVLLDINMPKLNGYEVCAALRSRIEWNDLRIVMLTAKGRDVEGEKGLAMGADEYVTKPFATQDVISMVKTLLVAIGDAVISDETRDQQENKIEHRFPTG